MYQMSERESDREREIDRERERAKEWGRRCKEEDQRG